MSVEQTLAKAVIDGDVEAAKSAAQKVLNEGGDALSALENGAGAGMLKISQMFDDGEIYLPTIVMAADAMYAAVDVLKPQLTADQAKRAALGGVVIGTVEGDIHDIGKTLVAIILQGAGFDVTDKGRDVGIEDFADTAAEKDASIIAVSALMSTTTFNQEKVALDMKEKGSKAKLLIGGPCVTDEWCEKLGAQTANNAGAALAVAKKMVGV